jgi:hypothetical protein
MRQRFRLIVIIGKADAPLVGDASDGKHHFVGYAGDDRYVCILSKRPYHSHDPGQRDIHG